jgi:hypothetical protein
LPAGGRDGMAFAHGATGASATIGWRKTV